MKQGPPHFDCVTGLYQILGKEESGIPWIE